MFQASCFALVQIGRDVTWRLMTPLGVSVVGPTIGRPVQLREGLWSLQACVPAPQGVLVGDQSCAVVAQAVEDVMLAYPAVRHIRASERGIGRAINLGLKKASRDLVLVTNDDCTVA